MSCFLSVCIATALTYKTLVMCKCLPAGVEILLHVGCLLQSLWALLLSQDLDHLFLLMMLLHVAALMRQTHHSTITASHTVQLCMLCAARIFLCREALYT